MNDFITLNEYKIAYQKIKKFIKDTPIINIRNNLFLKQESKQVTGSFKWSGVLYSVMKTFDEILIHKNSPYFIVTQSTGNHGIAVIASVTLMIEHYSKLYPDLIHIWENITPGIFANQHIKSKKLEKMKKYLQQFKYNNRIFIDNSFKNYKESLIARTEFLKKNKGKYIEHGGKDIMTGYGSIAFSIDKQFPKGKSIAFGNCLSLLRKSEIVVSQTENFDAFVRSFKNKDGEIFENTQEIVPDISDGIAVDKPEMFALHVGKKIINKAFVIKNNEVKKKQKKHG